MGTVFDHHEEGLITPQPDTARERLRRVLEALTVLGEIQGTLREVAHSLVAELKATGQIQDDRPLDARIAGMHANRQVIGDTYREQRPVAAEQLLWAAADVAQGDSPARIARVLMTTLGRQRTAADPPVSTAEWQAVLWGRKAQAPAARAAVQFHLEPEAGE
jgi:hypothetical protein